MNTFAEYEFVKNCPICNLQRFALIFYPDVVLCSDCRTYFRNPRPSQSEIIKSYDAGATYDKWIEEEKSRELMWIQRFKLIHKYKPNGILLDVGCGDGHFLDIVRKFGGYITQGTEVSYDAILRAEKRGIDVKKGQLIEIDFNDNYFDIITLWHVLEHVPNPLQLLRKCHDLLKNGGCLVIAVPNEENKLFRKRLGLLKAGNPLGDINWGSEIHLTHFQPTTLKQLCSRVGFKIIRFGVDDVYHHKNVEKITKLYLQKTISFFTGWHFSMAMYVIAKK